MTNARTPFVPASTEEYFSWTERANCKGADLNQFYLTRDTSKKRDLLIREVKEKYCSPCPSIYKCLIHILKEETYTGLPSMGIWGGTHGKERSVLLLAIKRRANTTEELVQRWLRGVDLYDHPLVVAVWSVDTGDKLYELGVYTEQACKIGVGKATKNLKRPWVATVTTKETGGVTFIWPYRTRVRDWRLSRKPKGDHG